MPVCTYAVCSADRLEEAKRLTHDRLIARLGAERRSGVVWRIVPPAETQEALADLVASTGEQVDPNALALLAANPGQLWVVFAGADVHRPPGTQFGTAS